VVNIAVVTSLLFEVIEGSFVSWNASEKNLRFSLLVLAVGRRQVLQNGHLFHSPRVFGLAMKFRSPARVSDPSRSAPTRMRGAEVIRELSKLTVPAIGYPSCACGTRSFDKCLRPVRNRSRHRTYTRAKPNLCGMTNTGLRTGKVEKPSCSISHFWGPARESVNFDSYIPCSLGAASASLRNCVARFSSGIGHIVFCHRRNLKSFPPSSKSR
jgi:hypothetical protein